jgi:hypothetical protein
MTKCEKIYKYIRISTILIFILLITQGCIVFHPEYSKKDEKGYYLYHHNACGPVALEKALQALGETVSREDISQEIQSKGNLRRKIMSLIHYEGIRITWPSEIEDTARAHGYKTKIIKNLSELQSGDVSIVLLLGDNSIFQYHWVSSPEDKDIKNYFGKDTQILKIYKFVPAD